MSESIIRSQVEEFATAELTALAVSEGATAHDAADASNGNEVTAFAICLQTHEVLRSSLRNAAQAL